MMRHTAWILLLVLALLAASCRSTRHTTPTPPPEAATPVPQRLHTVSNFNATVEGVSMNGQLRMAQDSAMWVTVNKLVELGRALATTDSVWVSAPMMEVNFSGTYEELSRKAGRKLTYEMLQALATSPNAEAELARLAAELGFTAEVHFGERREVSHVSMPYRKPVKKTTP